MRNVNRKRDIEKECATPSLFAFSSLRQRLVRRFHQYPEPVLAQFGEPFNCALLPEFSELPYDHGSQAIAYRILVVEHVLENGVEQGQEVLTDFLGVRRRLPDISRIFGFRLVFQLWKFRQTCLLQDTVCGVSALDLAWNDNFQLRPFRIAPDLMACSALPLFPPARVS